MTALVAGHETTASELAWGFERLSREPAVLERLYEELDGDSDEAYLTATVQEILRHRPVLPHAEPRLVKQPIEIGGFTYQPGVMLAAFAHLVHHDPAIYPEPHAFRPERFIEREGGKAPGTYTWIPFGGGRRRCLGASFALLEMKLALRAVLERCELHPVGAHGEQARRRNITVSPARGCEVILRERTARRRVSAPRWLSRSPPENAPGNAGPPESEPRQASLATSQRRVRRGATSDRARRRLAPQPFEAVELARDGREDVDDHVEVVHQHPLRAPRPFHPPWQDAELTLGALVDSVVDRLHLAVGVAGADQEEVGVADQPAHVELEHVVRLLLQGEPGQLARQLGGGEHLRGWAHAPAPPAPAAASPLRQPRHSPRRFGPR